MITQSSEALPHSIPPNTPQSPLQQTQICPPPLVPSTPSLLWAAYYRLVEDGDIDRTVLHTLQYTPHYYRYEHMLVVDERRVSEMSKYN